MLTLTIPGFSRSKGDRPDIAANSVLLIHIQKLTNPKLTSIHSDFSQNT